MTLGEPLIRPIITRSPTPAAAAPATRMSPVQAEQRQLTRRYHAAVSYLGSPSVDARIGGIHALQCIMQDSPATSPPSSPCCARLSATGPTPPPPNHHLYGWLPSLRQPTSRPP